MLTVVVDGIKVSFHAHDIDAGETPESYARKIVTPEVIAEVRAMHSARAKKAGKLRRRRTAARVNGMVRDSVMACLKGQAGPRRAAFIERLLRYRISDLRARIEAAFADGMTWDNHGAWHLDHRRPLSSFRINKLACRETRDAWAIDNLQPLWAADNLRKGARWCP